MVKEDASTSLSCDNGPTRSLLRWLGLISLLVYIGILILSFQFRYGDDFAGRPILAVLGCFGLATGIYWLALFFVLRQSKARSGPLLKPILWYAAAFRVVLLFSAPIQEIDYYRYLWDGRVTLHGFNPYAYSPADVERHGLEAEADTELARLYHVTRASSAVTTIFERVHYREVPTAYPPLAQLVFAVSVVLTPVDAPVCLHVLMLKVILVFFDLGVLAVLVLLLRHLRLPASWCIAYAWCPLALKEIANSGHLDAIAIFCTTASLYLLIKAAYPRTSLLRSIRPYLAASVFLGLGILAKNYPIVLVPVIAAFLARHLRWRAIAPLAVAATVVAAGYLPFVQSERRDTPSARLVNSEEGGFSSERKLPWTGLTTFLTRWQANDLLFMIVHENLSWRAGRTVPWCAIVPATWRERLQGPLRDGADLLGFSQEIDPAFLATQGIMASALVALWGVLAIRLFRQPGPLRLLRYVFLSLAWGWLLSSTQNPWYLLWAWPLVLFVKQKSWWLLPGLAFLYYLRFWLEYQSLESEATWRAARAQFNFVVVWWEHGPFFLMMLAESLGRCRRRPGSATHTGMLSDGRSA